MDSVSARRIGAQFEGLLLEKVLSPMQSAFGVLGDIVTPALAQSIAQHDRGGFARIVAAALARRNG